MKCPVCKKELVLDLYPDYTASGIWCAECGIGFANPKSELPEIPEGLVDLIDSWVCLWEISADHIEEYRDLDYLINSLISSGNYLVKLVRDYIPCVDMNNYSIEWLSILAKQRKGNEKI